MEESFSVRVKPARDMHELAWNQLQRPQERLADLRSLPDEEQEEVDVKRKARARMRPHGQ